MLETVLRLITEIVGMPGILVEEPMSRHTTFKIGGPADVIIEPPGEKQLAAVMKMLKRFKVPYFVMGNGSNLLVGDKGIRGAVVKISGTMSKCGVDEDDDTIIRAESGVKLSKLANTALNNALSGFEFAAGIPGTLGGAVYMNAGAYGGEMKDVIKEVTFIDTSECSIHTIPVEECDFGYRKSRFSSGDAIITGAAVKLENRDMTEIREKMNDLAERRRSKQPLDRPSAGSTFKRPEGYFAGTLIQDTGLKGYRIGGAEVSEKHAGFIVNAGGATAKDVRELIEYVKAEVEKKYGVELEPEVKFVGEF